MMKINVNVWLLTLGILLLLLGTSAETPDVIYWSENYKLTWSDFEGTPKNENKSVSALTSSGIVHYTGCEKDYMTYKVRSYFQKNESWVKDEARTNHHLRHEQIHFDITELYARKLRKALSEKGFKCGQEAAFEAYVAHFLKQWREDQDHYDVTSQHSMDKVVQREWFYKTAMELSLYKNYKEILDDHDHKEKN